jgi:hypothetical protein
MPSRIEDQAQQPKGTAFTWGAELLHGTERFAEFLTETRRGFAKRFDDFFLRCRRHLFLRQGISIGAIDGVHADEVLSAQVELASIALLWVRSQTFCATSFVNALGG